ncbi:hypothetical protein L1887_15348 [Cichorium endivia]|nr:hypothetical protein L1887_15348 [Cichorium endivia]
MKIGACRHCHDDVGRQRVMVAVGETSRPKPFNPSSTPPPTRSSISLILSDLLSHRDPTTSYFPDFLVAPNRVHAYMRRRSPPI